MSSHAFIWRDEALFLLLWSSGYIGAKFRLPHAGNYTLLFLRYALFVCRSYLYDEMLSANFVHVTFEDNLVISASDGHRKVCKLEA